MIRKLLTYITGDILVKGLGFVTLPLYSYLITPAEYGTLGLLNAIVAFLPVVLTLSYINGFVRFFFEYEEGTIVSTFVYLGLILNIIYFFIAMSLYYFYIFSFQVEWFYFLIAVFTSNIIFIFHILLVYYRSQSMADKYMKVTVVYGIFAVLLNLVYLLTLEDNVLAMLLASLTNSLAVSIYALNVLRKHIRFRSVNWSLARDILKFTAPLTLGSIGLLMFSQLDKLVLAEYISKESLGIYTLAFSVALAVSYLGKALFMSYQPVFFQEAEKQTENIVKNHCKIILFILGAMLLTFITIGIVYQFINIKYIEGMKVALIVAMAYTFLIHAQMMELHLSYIKKTGVIAIVYSIGGVSSLISLFALVPVYGMIGASYALLISGFIISVTMYIQAQRYYYLAYEKKDMIMFYLTLLIVFVSIFMADI